MAREHGIVSALLYSLISSGVYPTESTDQYAVVEEAVEVARLLGDRQGEIVAESFRGTVATRERNWRVALQSFAESAAKQFDYGETVTLMGPCWWGSFALCHLGELELAASAMGFAAEHFPMLTDVETMALRSEADALLREGLGDDEVVRLKSSGAAMSTRELVALLQEAAAAFEGDPR